MLFQAVQDFLAEQYAVSNAFDAEFAAMRAMQDWMILCFDNDLDMVTGRKIGMWDNYYGGGGGSPGARTGDDNDNEMSKNGLTGIVAIDFSQYLNIVFEWFFGFSFSGNQDSKEPMSKDNLSANAKDNVEKTVRFLLFPDFFGFSIGFSGVAGVGAGTSFDVTWMKGQSSPIFTLTQSIGFGMNVSPFYFSINRFDSWGINDLNYSSIFTSIGDNYSFGVYTSGGYDHFGGSFSISPSNGGFLSEISINISPFNYGPFSVGVFNSYSLFNWWW